MWWPKPKSLHQYEVAVRTDVRIKPFPNNLTFLVKAIRKGCIKIKLLLLFLQWGVSIKYNSGNP
jgi:hypothetical protein